MIFIGAVDLEGGEIQISVSSAKQVNELAPKKVIIISSAQF